jgi:hypothetical protein
MKEFLIKNKLAYIIPVVVFLGFTIWWFYLRGFSLEDSRNMRQIWGATYQIFAFYGGIIGVIISYKWGGHRSTLGRAILAFSIGLFLQCFGQTYSSYYVFHYAVESPPYPAIGDIGFFGSVIAYIYGVILLYKVSGAGFSIQKTKSEAWVFLIPIVALGLSYHFFLQGYQFDWSQKIKIFLDFGYPFGQALYVSIALVTLIASRNMLGGIMRMSILFLLFALLFQYFSDFFFLYQSNAGTWHVGNINDYMYSASYLIMSLSLIELGSAFERVKED